MIDRFAVIIGGMRCGTTSLFHLLAQHPEIAACSDKEPAFFSNEKAWAKGREYYEEFWNFDPNVHSIALEASTNYYKTHLFPDVAKRMAAFGSTFRVIFSVRDPLDRIESHYILGAAKGWRESARPLSGGIHPEFIACSRYATTLDVFTRQFSSDSIHVVDFAEFTREPEATLRKICSFLGVSADFQFQDVRSPRNTNMGRRPGDAGQRLYRVRTRIPFWTWLARRIPQKQIDRVRRLFARTGRLEPLMRPEERAAVLRELAPELIRLESEYRVNVGSWQCMSANTQREGATDRGHDQ